MFPFGIRCTPEHTRLVDIPNLVFHYKLNNTTGDVIDSSVNADHGTNSGATRGVAGKIGNSFEFDGVNDSITNASNAGALAIAGGNDFSVMFWARSTVYELGSAIAIRDGTNTSRLFQMYPYSDATNGFAMYWNGTAMNTGVVVSNDDTWHHFAISSVTNTNHRMFVDGVYIGTFSTNKTMHQFVQDVNVGNWVSSEWYDGGIDDVRIYDRALSDAEILQIGGI